MPTELMIVVAIILVMVGLAVGAKLFSSRKSPP